MKHKYVTVVIAAVAILAAPALVNLVTNTVLQHRYPVPGSFYGVNGRPMHLYCTGHGDPTVILDAGGGNDWLIWHKVQPEAANTMRVCSYDREGTGLSESQSGVMDAKKISQKLHLLLKIAGEKPPFVMVAASVAGFYARQYVDQYPAEVAGLVLVDSSAPEQIAEIPGSGYSPELIRQKHREVMIEWWKEAPGWALLKGDCNPDLEPGLESYGNLARAEMRPLTL